MYFLHMIPRNPQTNINRLVFVMGRKYCFCGVGIQFLNVLLTLTRYLKPTGSLMRQQV